jgi:hypothetical protein
MGAQCEFAHHIETYEFRMNQSQPSQDHKLEVTIFYNKINRILPCIRHNYRVVTGE